MKMVNPTEWTPKEGPVDQEFIDQTRYLSHLVSSYQPGVYRESNRTCEVTVVGRPDEIAPTCDPTEGAGGSNWWQSEDGTLGILSLPSPGIRDRYVHYDDDFEYRTVKNPAYMDPADEPFWGEFEAN